MPSAIGLHQKDIQSTYMQFELLAVVRLARASVAASFTLPLSELIILIRAGIPSVKESKYMKHRFPLHYHCQSLSF